MANEHRGETPFRALGRDYYLVYGTRELANIRTALGFRRPDPMAPTTIEDVESEIEVELPGEPGKWQKQRQRKTITVGFALRNQRVLEAFEAVFMNPGPDELLIMVREGLRRWEKETGHQITPEEFEGLTDRIGELRLLHFRAVSTSIRQSDGGGEGEADPNAPSAGPASSTSTASS